MQTLGKKLNLKTGSDTLLLNAPEQVVSLLESELYTIATARDAGKQYDAVQLFVHERAELEAYLPIALESLKPEGMLWIAYPKKSSGVTSDLTRDEGWKVVFDLGYQGVRQVSINEVWSSLRFKHKSERKEPSKFGAEYPGIDKSARTVTPPADLQTALEEANLEAKFQKLSFTCKKEYVVAVLEAKRAETRANRISKTIEQVAAK